MRAREISKAVRTQPFRPFALRTADGLRYDVPHPEFVSVHPDSERTVIVTTGPDDWVVLDPMLISAVEFTTNGKPSTDKQAE